MPTLSSSIPAVRSSLCAKPASCAVHWARRSNTMLYRAPWGVGARVPGLRSSSRSLAQLARCPARPRHSSNRVQRSRLDVRANYDAFSTEWVSRAHTRCARAHPMRAHTRCRTRVARRLRFFALGWGAFTWPSNMAVTMAGPAHQCVCAWRSNAVALCTGGGRATPPDAFLILLANAPCVRTPNLPAPAACWAPTSTTARASRTR